ncbi:hypothetical protein HPB51_000940 [Rhipicephalus microplus]|uniref:Uncharacterized protein n=1 Tax=Rhipicephalus microplus TaxID=6941 RepID=A0A9J6DLB4_RHIMP|nr:hypothetical protein HPB51_000940 [Rhipicephalus microplus]
MVLLSTRQSGTSTTAEAPRGRNSGNNIKARIIRAGQMPQLPREDTKIVIRPHGGLNIVKSGCTVVADAILAATSICAEDLRGDTLCPNCSRILWLPAHIEGKMPTTTSKFGRSSSWVEHTRPVPTRPPLIPRARA